MLETFAGFLMAEHLYGQTYVPPTGAFGSTTTLTPHRRPFATRDGYLMVLPANNVQSAKFMELGGLPDAYNSERFLSKQGGKARVAEYYAMMEEASAAHTTEEWMQLGAQHSIPLMRANAPTEVFDDPQLCETLFETRQIAGEGSYRAMKPGLRFARTPATIRRDPPHIGQDTDEVLREIGL
jgi:crotonobetainyl-CoA:carnitine CoA-transferase CaiB-like acyl-CoA transferase